ncbi:protein of unknown function (plasmid) [Caballeronia sp. S22]
MIGRSKAQISGSSNSLMSLSPEAVFSPSLRHQFNYYVTPVLRDRLQLGCV